MDAEVHEDVGKTAFVVCIPLKFPECLLVVNSRSFTGCIVVFLCERGEIGGERGLKSYKASSGERGLKSYKASMTVFLLNVES